MAWAMKNHPTKRLMTISSEVASSFPKGAVTSVGGVTPRRRLAPTRKRDNCVSLDDEMPLHAERCVRVALK